MDDAEKMLRDGDSPLSRGLMQAQDKFRLYANTPEGSAALKEMRKHLVDMHDEIGEIIQPGGRMYDIGETLNAGPDRWDDQHVIEFLSERLGVDAYSLTVTELLTKARVWDADRKETQRSDLGPVAPRSHYAKAVGVDFRTIKELIDQGGCRWEESSKRLIRMSISDRIPPGSKR